MDPQTTQIELSDSAGFTLPELLIAFAVIGVMSSMAVINFQKSRSNLNVASAARTLSAHVEKVRVDSLRRHGGGSISINSESSYTINIDSAGTGAAIAQKIILPVGARLTYSLPPSTASIMPSDTPILIAYDWRGRTATTVSLTLTDSSTGMASNTIVVGQGGDVSAGTAVTGPVTNPTPQNTLVTTTTGIKSMY
jgi:prepilin-type N-terminal cleavage/methylation domain-containing protein